MTVPCVEQHFVSACGLSGSVRALLFPKITNFIQVWNPNENVLKRLRDLEFKCSNTTLEWERHLDRLQRRVLEEMISARYF